MNANLIMRSILMALFSRTGLFCIGLVSMVGGWALPFSAHAVPVTLQDLLNGSPSSIVVGDKEFFSFGFTSTATGGAEPAMAKDIEVIPKIHDFGPGLIFVGVGASPVNDKGPFFVGPGQTKDVKIFFDVETVSGRDLIIDNELVLGTFGTDGEGRIDITEIVKDEFGIEIARKFVTSVDPLRDHKFFAPQNHLQIEKQIHLTGGPPGMGGRANLASFHQDFSQIPELDVGAGTGALTLLAGTLGLLAEQRRRPRSDVKA